MMVFLIMLAMVVYIAICCWCAFYVPIVEYLLFSLEVDPYKRLGYCFAWTIITLGGALLIIILPLTC